MAMESVNDAKFVVERSAGSAQRGEVYRRGNVICASAEYASRLATISAGWAW
jgi:hypothetical protein